MAISLHIFCFFPGGDGDEGLDVYALEQGLGVSRYSWNERGSGLRSDAIETMMRILGRSLWLTAVDILGGNRDGNAISVGVQKDVKLRC